MDTENYSKTTHSYCCKFCNYVSSNNSNYKKHLRTKKHLAKVENMSRKWQQMDVPNKSKFFRVCGPCNYNAPKKYNWDKHVETTKHKRKMIKSGKKWQKVAKSGNSTVVEDESDTTKPTIMIEPPTELDKLEQLAQQVSLLTNTLNKVVEKPTQTIINNNNQTNNISFNLFLDKHCHNAQSLQDFVDNITFKLNDILKEDNVIENFVSRKMIRNLSDIPVTERPIHCTDQKRRNFFVKDKHEGWVKDVPGDEINSHLYDSVNQLHKKAYMDFYTEYDKINPLPHDTTTENIKCKISSELLKKPTKVVINDIAKNVDIRDIIENVDHDKLT
jgi:hypothetical protein